MITRGRTASVRCRPPRGWQADETPHSIEWTSVSASRAPVRKLAVAVRLLPLLAVRGAEAASHAGSGAKDYW
ncbi:hypothetical protein ACE1SV_62980 [Streptomyces sennicomposti]